MLREPKIIIGPLLRRYLAHSALLGGGFGGEDRGGSQGKVFVRMVYLGAESGPDMWKSGISSSLMWGGEGSFCIWTGGLIIKQKLRN